ncbi:MAG TPA: hypothetical protein VKN74_07280 [Candidatus Mcinerneyibacterium sp.]|nr:hypothetical protein [Candidatus Mcinerneyibacterium sp.]
MVVDKKKLEKIERRLSERQEYLVRDLDLLLKNLNNIKDSVVNFSGEIEKIKNNLDNK